MTEQRISEAAKLGFTTCIVPEVNRKQLKPIEGVRIVGVKTVQDAIDCI